MSETLNPDFATVRHYMETALQFIYRNDLVLITNNTSERAITHKLAEYLQPLYPTWHVDCEYNRLGKKPKAILEKATSFPDIIVHRRGICNNLLIIEAKNIHSENHGDKDDKEKITAYIEDHDFQYQFGLWICFYDNIGEIKLDWYENHNGTCQSVSL